jgi:hypothetical protein
MEHTTREIEIRTTRPIWKSWYAFQQFVNACKEWKRVTYLHPDFKLYSPKIVESIEKEAQARWEKIGEERGRKELADFIRENRNTVTLVQIENLIDNL